MTQKKPFDVSEYFKPFDAEAVAKLFSPQSMFDRIQPQTASSMFDMEGIIKANQRNFEAMKEANQAAAETYKDLLDKQMEIFGKMTVAARQQYEWAEDTAGPDTLKAKTEAMSQAVEEALQMMRKLADATREANEEVYEKVKTQVDDAVQKLQKKK